MNPESPALPAHHSVVLLIDDQRIICEAVKRMLLTEPDIEFHYTCDPSQALALARQLCPTLILQDLVMPDTDGLDLVRAFRADADTAQVPLIVLSSKEEAVVKAEAFRAGANDYLVKLPDRIELIARIRYHCKAYIALLERNEAFAALEKSQRTLAAELAEAAAYVRSLLPPPLERPGLATAWEFLPSSSLGGDAFGYFDIDAEHFAVFLLDVCGHGVGSALLSVSAMNALMGQSLGAVDFREPAAVLVALNGLFPMEKHNNLYFTLWYGVAHLPSRTLRYASAGHPPAVLLGGAEPGLLRCRAMPIGTWPEARFETGAASLPDEARLYLFSDGLYEIDGPDGAAVEFEAFVRVLAEPEGRPGRKIAEVVAAMRAWQGREDFDDDVSLLEVRIA